MRFMKSTLTMSLSAILVICGTSVQAQTKRSEAFHAKYKLKEEIGRASCRERVCSWV